MMALLAPASAVPSALLALAVFRVPAWACLLCFTTYSERFRICQMFVGLQSPKLEACEEDFTAAFRGLSDTEISEETIHLHRCPGKLAEGGAGESQRVRLRDRQTAIVRGERLRDHENSRG
ncbi:Sperm acrosome membrane-associated protein 6 [Plecturocebus cupreus]